MLTHLSLFSGIGGIDIAAEWAGFTTIGQCEFADYPYKILKKHWPDVPKWRDIRDLTGGDFYERTGHKTVDVISGGFPCQPFSVAGKQKGKGDDRYLWPEMLRVITEIKPTWVIGENVSGIIKIAGKTVCEDLERAGYTVTVFDFEAAAVGAPHRRERVFFVGYTEHDGRYGTAELRSNEATSYRCEEKPEKARESEGTGRSLDVSGAQRSTFESERTMENTGRSLRERSVVEKSDGKEVGNRNADIFKRPGCTSGADVANTDNTGGRTSNCGTNENGQEKDKKRKDKPQLEPGGSSENVANTDKQRLQGRERKELPKRTGKRAAWKSSCTGAEQWEFEPDVGRVANGIPHRVDRLKCLGNAVVPQQIYPILQAIETIEETI